jgi:cytoskeletal protein CcmA (bactofilin family)
MGFWKAGFGDHDENKQSTDLPIQQQVVVVREKNTVFGEGTFIEGKLTFDSDVVIGGEIKGFISASQLVVVEQTGVVSADLDVGDLSVSGTVMGEVTARGHVHITSTGQIIGNIRCSSLSVEKGGVLRGHCYMEPKNIEVTKTQQI